MIELETKTEQFIDGTRVVSVVGELDLASTAAFERELGAAIASGPKTVIVDLTECEFLDSTALGVLLGVRKELADSPCELAVVTSDRNIRKVFEITGCDQLFEIHATRDAAMNGGLHRV